MTQVTSSADRSWMRRLVLRVPGQPVFLILGVAIGTSGARPFLYPGAGFVVVWIASALLKRSR